MFDKRENETPPNDHPPRKRLSGRVILAIGAMLLAMLGWIIALGWVILQFGKWWLS